MDLRDLNPGMSGILGLRSRFSDDPRDPSPMIGPVLGLESRKGSGLRDSLRGPGRIQVT